MAYVLKTKNQHDSYLMFVYEHDRSKLTFQFTYFPFAALKFDTRREALQYAKAYKIFTPKKIKN